MKFCYWNLNRMKIAVVTILPDMLSIMFDYGVSGRAIKSGLVKLAVFNPRDFTQDIHRTVDSRPYGGGPGMIMMVEPLKKAVAAARSWVSESDTLVVYLSPQGQLLCHSFMEKSVKRKGLILVAGRFEGVDERFISLEVDEEWSIGDYVLSGGELAAMVVSDAIIRLIPGALGHEDAAAQDSFSSGLLEHPQYARPNNFGGLKVPEVLLSGDHDRIKNWRKRQSLIRTRSRRPDIFASLSLSEEQRNLIFTENNDL